MKIRGFRIELGEVEAAALTFWDEPVEVVAPEQVATPEQVVMSEAVVSEAQFPAADETEVVAGEERGDAQSSAAEAAAGDDDDDDLTMVQRVDRRLPGFAERAERVAAVDINGCGLLRQRAAYRQRRDAADMVSVANIAMATVHARAGDAGRAGEAQLAARRALSTADAGPEQIGAMIAHALVGTFLGILLGYGFINPLASRMERQVKEAEKMLQLIRVTLLASLHGYAPQLAVEFGRKALALQDRPAFNELEDYVRQAKNNGQGAGGAGA